MFELVLQRVLTAMGASDQAIAVMGPSFTMFLAVVGGTAAAQFLKFPLAWYSTHQDRFSWYVRALAIALTFGFAHVLSDTVPWPLELLVGLVQPFLYHWTLAGIRRWWPWMEMKPFVGAVCPPPAAQAAAAQRKADQAGDESGT